MPAEVAIAGVLAGMHLFLTSPCDGLETDLEVIFARTASSTPPLNGSSGVLSFISNRSVRIR